MQLCPMPKSGEMSIEFGSMVINHVPPVDVPPKRGWSRDTIVGGILQSFPRKARSE